MIIIIILTKQKIIVINHRNQELEEERSHYLQQFHSTTPNGVGEVTKPYSTIHIITIMLKYKQSFNKYEMTS